MSLPKRFGRLWISVRTGCHRSAAIRNRGPVAALASMQVTDLHPKSGVRRFADNARLPGANGFVRSAIEGEHLTEQNPRGVISLVVLQIAAEQFLRLLHLSSVQQ